MNALIESLKPLSVLQEMWSNATSVGDMAMTLIVVFSMLEWHNLKVGQHLPNPTQPNHMLPTPTKPTHLHPMHLDHQTKDPILPQFYHHKDLVMCKIINHQTKLDLASLGIL